MNIIQTPASPENFTPGRVDTRVTPNVPYNVSLIVLHTEQGYEAGTDAWFANPDSEVSAHYSIGLNGDIHQHVQEADTAWHAGVWSVNLQSIGIEFEDDDDPFNVVRTPEQYASAGVLIADICTRHNLAPNRTVIRKHNEVSSTHPLCPGNLDVDHVAAVVAGILAPPTSGVLDNIVNVTVSKLNVRLQPNSESPIASAYYKGAVHVKGWIVGEKVTIGTKTDSIWLESDAGHWASQAGTDSNFGHK